MVRVTNPRPTTVRASRHGGLTDDAAQGPGGPGEPGLGRAILADLRRGVLAVGRGTTRRDLVAGAVVAVVWFVALEAVARTSFWFPAPEAVASLRLTGVFLVLVVVARHCAPTGVFWLTVVCLPLLVNTYLYPDLLVVPLLLAAYRAAVAGRTPVAVLGVASVASTVVLSVGTSRLHALPHLVPDLVGGGDGGWLDPSQTVARTVLAFVVVALGFAVHRFESTRRTLAERDAELLCVHDEHAQAEVRAERTRIARELHDVVAHHISAVVLRAEAADLVADDDPDEPRQAVRAIAGMGREALDAVRSVVRMLRDRDPDDGAGVDRTAAVPESTPWHPTDTMAELPAVIARVASAGLRVDAHLPDPLPQLGAAAELAVVRVAAEALTNVLLHSQATRAELWLDVSDGRVQLGVADPGPPVDDVSSGGHGLMHMRERAESAAGTLEAGPEWPGWLVVLEVPTGVPDSTAGGQGPGDDEAPDDEAPDDRARDDKARDEADDREEP